MKVRIAHDYLVQRGGAESVVLTWADHLQAQSIVTLAYRPELTFDGFARHTVEAKMTSALSCNSLEAMLPALPSLAKRTHVRDADVALVSSSGWAHGFTNSLPTVLYVHSPARWLYASDDYRLKLSRIKSTGLSIVHPYLRRWDQRTPISSFRVLANSRVTQSRIGDAYGIDSEIVHPPARQIRDAPQIPSPFRAEREFALIVSRNRGYKNISQAIAAAHLAGREVVVVGAGTEDFDVPSDGTHGLGRVSDAELRWLYQNCAVIVGAAYEDFGLTIVEANMEGAPAACVPVGGYLETVVSGSNGALAHSSDTADLARAINEAALVERQSCMDHAQKFTEATHLAAIREALADVA
jgi:glycosyltransferase involved in cell wall biosynthesis